MRSLRFSIIILGLIYGSVSFLINAKPQPLARDFQYVEATISQIVSQPSLYRKHLILTRGKVVGRGNLPGIRYYTIRDQEGSQISVVPRQNFVPDMGQKVEVRGQLKQIIALDDMESLALYEW